MTRLGALLARLRHDASGAAIVETAVVVPVLAILSLGGFEVSNIVARQSELQAAAAEAAAIALAAKPDTADKRDDVEEIIRTSTRLQGASAVTLTPVFRCQGMDGYHASTADCDADTVAWAYVQIDMTDSYAPLWTSFGMGAPMEFNVRRYVLVAG